MCALPTLASRALLACHDTAMHCCCTLPHALTAVTSLKSSVQPQLLTPLTESPCVLQLCDLYENDCIFDKFDCAISGNGQYVTTGSYNNFLKVTGTSGGPDTIVEASRDPLRKRLQPQAKVCICEVNLRMFCNAWESDGHAALSWVSWNVCKTCM